MTRTGGRFMADTEARILEMVRRELEKDRSVATDVLFEKATKIDPSVARMTPRQFHAKYPLQIKRRMKSGGGAARKGTARKRATTRRGPGRPAGTKTARKAGRRATAKGGTQATRGRRRTSSASAAAATPAAGRGDVRSLLLQFAKQVAQAGDKAEMVDVLAGIDTWVDRMVRAASNS